MSRHTVLGIVIATLFSLVSCSKEAETPEYAGPETISIEVGFEEPGQEADTPDTKTYVYGNSYVWWSSAEIDKYIYVFDTEGQKNVFSSTSSSTGPVKTFTGNLTAGSGIKMILWSGKLPADDTSKLTDNPSQDDPGNTDDQGGSVGAGNQNIGQGGSITLETKASGSSIGQYLAGSSLRVVNPQQIDYSYSFATDANISVAQAGNKKLKSVFGFMKFSIPAGADGSAAIKSITISADELLSGAVAIDCSQSEPVATVLPGGSNSLTVITRWNTSGGGYYAPGTYFAVLPAGTYHNMKVTINPFASDGRSQDAATGTPFTISCRGPVTINRGQFSDIGYLPSSRPTSTQPGFIFDTDFFTKVTDASGVVSYLIRSNAIGWDNSQTLYFMMNEMTNDERFLVFMVSDNEFRPSYHVASHSAKILDLQTRKLYTFYASDACYPYLDPVEDKLYYMVVNSKKDGAKFYRRDLLTDPGTDIPLADFPQSLIGAGLSNPIKRAVSHITLTSDKQKVFLDSWVKETSGESFHWGLLDLYSGEWDEWGSSTEENFTHGQINPMHDDEALCATDGWTDSKGTTHKLQKDADGTTRRMQYVKKGYTHTIMPDTDNSASHEGWAPGGDIVYWCSSGIHIRNIRTGEHRKILSTTPGVTQATHCNPSGDMKYWTYDDNSPYWYRGCSWKVIFYNDVTGKQVYIHSKLPAIAVDKNYPSRIHPDPHPHFVCNDKYIICSAAQDDGNLHCSITPVDQLIPLTQ